MEALLLEKLLELKQLILESDSYKNLIFYENKLNNDINLFNMKIKINKLQEEYKIEVSKNNKDNKKIKQIKKEFNELSKVYYDNEIVKNYLKYYAEVKDFYSYIDENLIYIFNKDIKKWLRLLLGNSKIKTY